MTQSLQKFTIAAAIIILATFSFFAVLNQVEAWAGGSGGEGGCCGGSTGGGTGGDDDGDDTPVTACSITASVSAIETNGQYTVNWDVRNANIVKLNNEVVSASGSRNFTMSPGIQYQRFVIFGDGTGNNCDQEVVVQREIPAPICDITSNLSVVNVGDAFRVSWNGTPVADTTFRVNGTVVAASDAATYNYPNDGRQSVTFTLTGTNAGGDCTDSVTIGLPPTTPALTCSDVSFTASRYSVSPGSTVTLSWVLTGNVGTATVNRGIGAINSGDTRVVTINSQTTYITTIANSVNSVDCPITINVSSTPTPFTCANNVTFTASPTSIRQGNSSTLTWSTTGVTSLSFNRGITDTRLSGNTSVSPNTNTTYTLTASNGVNTINCPVSVTVTSNPNPATITCEDNVTFSANPTSFRKGNSSTLTWSTTGITSVSFNRGISDTRLSGSTTVSPDSDTTYTLTASNGANTIHCPVSVSVSTGGGGGGYVIPRCELTASDRSISAGQRVTLEWDSQHATRVALTDNRNTRIFSTSDRDKFSGETIVRPTRDTTYTLTVTRGDRDRECEVKIEIDGGGVVVVENRDQQPLMSGISLTQVPYTGFEAGPFLTILFYTLLLGWALYLAYAVIVKRSGADMPLAVATTPVMNESVLTQPSSFKQGEYTRPSFHSTAAPHNLPTDDTVVGYANQVEEITPTIPNLDQTVVTAIENRAHAGHVLFSSDAMRYFINTTEGADRMAVLDAVIKKVTAEYPTEDGWVVLNQERITGACAACMVTPTEAQTEVAVGSGSLAEAIVTGNVVAAYQMIGHRPMIALADAAADLDAAFRATQGEHVTISKLLATESASVPAEKLQAAIKALTGALDGTYSTEEEAVKMAIMKAVKAVS